VAKELVLRLFWLRTPFDVCLCRLYCCYFAFVQVGIFVSGKFGGIGLTRAFMLHEASLEFDRLKLYTEASPESVFAACDSLL
jgi:hypothetical protein